MGTEADGEMDGCVNTCPYVVDQARFGSFHDFLSAGMGSKIQSPLVDYMISSFIQS